MSTSLRPELLAALLDDAAIFPPGDLPLAEAVPAHAAHLLQPYAAVLGPLVVGLRDLPALGASIHVAVTVALPQVGTALRDAERLGVRLAWLEVSLPDGMDPDRVRELPAVSTPTLVYVEVPRDARRDAVLDSVAAAGLRAKLRTGGVRADLHPGEAELAEVVAAAVALSVPFKVTAGLHHAVRTTEAGSGFEQHGFLNLLVATAAARAGADAGLIARVLAERDEDEVVARAHELTPEVRQSLCSIGTCSITEPLDELRRLGLLPRDWDEGAA